MVIGRPSMPFTALPIGLELLVFARHVAATEENEFGAEQADALGAAFEDGANVIRFLDVGKQVDLDLVERRRRGPS